MSDKNKPLSAAEIIKRIDSALWLHDVSAREWDEVGTIPAGAYRALVDAKRLLSMLQPPSDAAVLEAVRYFDDLRGEWSDEQLEDHLDTLLSFVRAAQAPRLEGERLEAVRMAYTGAEDEFVRKALDAAFPEMEG